MTWLIQYSDGCVQFLPTYSDDAGDVSHSTSILLEESLSMDLDVLYTSSAEHSESQSCTPVPEMTIIRGFCKSVRLRIRFGSHFSMFSIIYKGYNDIHMVCQM